MEKKLFKNSISYKKTINLSYIIKLTLFYFKILVNETSFLNNYFYFIYFIFKNQNSLLKYKNSVSLFMVFLQNTFSIKSI